jgi:hypothetical protein
MGWASTVPARRRTRNCQEDAVDPTAAVILHDPPEHRARRFWRSVAAVPALLIVLSWSPWAWAWTTTQLAGHSLTQYPYFEYVRTFHESCLLCPEEFPQCCAEVGIEVAIDPTRFPSVRGKTCDLYVAEPKEWDMDPSLVDVREDGPQSVVFPQAGSQQDIQFSTSPSRSIPRSRLPSRTRRSC